VIWRTIDLGPEPLAPVYSILVNLDRDERIRFKQILVEQALALIASVLPPSDADQGERSASYGAELWLREPTDENAARVAVSAYADRWDGGVRYHDYPAVFLGPTEIAGARDAEEAARWALSFAIEVARFRRHGWYGDAATFPDPDQTAAARHALALQLDAARWVQESIQMDGPPIRYCTEPPGLYDGLTCKHADLVVLREREDSSRHSTKSYTVYRCRTCGRLYKHIYSAVWQDRHHDGEAGWNVLCDRFYKVGETHGGVINLTKAEARTYLSPHSAPGAGPGAAAPEQALTAKQEMARRAQGLAAALVKALQEPDSAEYLAAEEEQERRTVAVLEAYHASRKRPGEPPGVPLADLAALQSHLEKRFEVRRRDSGLSVADPPIDIDWETAQQVVRFTTELAIGVPAERKAAVAKVAAEANVLTGFQLWRTEPHLVAETVAAMIDGAVWTRDVDRAIAILRTARVRDEPELRKAAGQQ
jgi:hypothetical protein